MAYSYKQILRSEGLLKTNCLLGFFCMLASQGHELIVLLPVFNMKIPAKQVGKNKKWILLEQVAQIIIFIHKSGRCILLMLCVRLTLELSALLGKVWIIGITENRKL